MGTLRAKCGKNDFRSEVFLKVACLGLVVFHFVGCADSPPSVPTPSAVKDGVTDPQNSGSNPPNPGQVPFQAPQTPGKTPHGSERFLQAKEWTPANGPHTVTWTVPQGVGKVTVEVWGGDGKKGKGVASGSQSGHGGEGGGGAYAKKSIDVQSGTTLSIEFFLEGGNDGYSVRMGTMVAQGGRVGGYANWFQNDNGIGYDCSNGEGGDPGSAIGGDLNVNGLTGDGACDGVDAPGPKGADPTGERAEQFKLSGGLWPAEAKISW